MSISILNCRYVHRYIIYQYTVTYYVYIYTYIHILYIYICIYIHMYIHSYDKAWSDTFHVTSRSLKRHRQARQELHTMWHRRCCTESMTRYGWEIRGSCEMSSCGWWWLMRSHEPARIAKSCAMRLWLWHGIFHSWDILGHEIYLYSITFPQDNHNHSWLVGYHIKMVTYSNYISIVVGYIPQLSHLYLISIPLISH